MLAFSDRYRTRKNLATHCAGILMSFASMADAAEAIEDKTISTAAAPQHIMNQLIVKVRTPQTRTPPSDNTMLFVQSDATHITYETPSETLQRVITRFNTPQADLFTQSNAPAANIAIEREMSGGAYVVTLPPDLDAEHIELVAKNFAAQPEIEYAEPDVLMQTYIEPTDPGYEHQWSYFAPTVGANFPYAWDFTTGSPNIVTAVIDTGYQMHADIAANILPGYDFISKLLYANDGDGRDADASDPGDWVTFTESRACSLLPYQRNSSWHGTKVASIIGAVAGNGIGGVGINWQGRLLPVRVIGKCGGALSDIADGIRWAAGLSVPDAPPNPHPAQILNISLGANGPCGFTLRNAVNDVLQHGSTIVVAVGNDNGPIARPANCPGVIAVAATNEHGHKSSVSNFGPSVTLSAPGTDIFVASNTGLTTPLVDDVGYSTGTSVAAPHVSGAIGLMLAVNPTMTPKQIREVLIETARPFPAGSDCANEPPKNCGAGIINAEFAVFLTKFRFYDKK